MEGIDGDGLVYDGQPSHRHHPPVDLLIEDRQGTHPENSEEQRRENHAGPGMKPTHGAAEGGFHNNPTKPNNRVRTHRRPARPIPDTAATAGVRKSPTAAV